MACSGTPQLDDHRGFLQAGDHNEASSELQWTATASKRVINSITSNGRRSSVASSISLHDYVPPVSEISPEELDLERTLVEQSPRLSVRKFSTPRESPFNGSINVISSSSSDQLSSSGFRDRTFTAGRSPQRSATISSLRRKSSFFQKLSSVMTKRKTSAPEQGHGSLEYRTDLTALSSAKLLRVELEKEGVDQDVDSLIHIIMRNKYKNENKRQKLLVALLTYSSVDVNARAPNGMTALHRAAEHCDVECAKILVCFGARINIIDNSRQTPLDLLRADIAEMESAFCMLPSRGGSELPHHKPTVVKRGSRRAMIKFLNSVGAVSGELSLSVSAPPVQPFPLVPIETNTGRGSNKDLSEAMDWTLQLTARYSELERNIRQRFHSASYTQNKLGFPSDEAISLMAQLHEMTMFQKAGSRILFLDGGGIRGLVQIEILCQLEQKTGRKIVELFDWIVGTSTGGIIALALVYAKKSVTEIRQLYFRMKDEIFGKVKGGMTFNTAGLEALLKEEFSEHVCMDDITYPRVLISAVKKEHINLKLHFFNNCFQDEYCKHWLVWKVARFTSAAPVLFGEFDDYVDGGVLANNPSESGLSKIQDFHRRRGEKLPISLVVSIGSGKYPIKKLGSVDFLFTGSSGFNLTSFKDGTSNLMSLLSYALVETSVSADNCKSRCEEQDIRYFRLNPRLEEVVDSGETDIKTLLSMILQTRRETNEEIDFSNVVLCFHELSEKCRKMHSQINGEVCSEGDPDN